MKIGLFSVLFVCSAILGMDNATKPCPLAPIKTYSVPTVKEIITQKVASWLNRNQNRHLIPGIADLPQGAYTPQKLAINNRKDVDSTTTTTTLVQKRAARTAEINDALLDHAKRRRRLNYDQE